MTTADIYRAYTEAGTPQHFFAYNGGAARTAVRVYARYMGDPMFEREPTPDEIRTIAAYCEYFINAPCWVYPADEIRLLRLSILRVETASQLTGWLWGCHTIGIGPVLGVG